MKLKVYVEDHDDNSNDYVDFLQTVISLAPAKSENTAITNTYYLRRRVRYVKSPLLGCNVPLICYIIEDFVNASPYFCTSSSSKQYID